MYSSLLKCVSEMDPFFTIMMLKNMQYAQQDAKKEDI
jgi:hypothetical protein